MSGKAAPRRPPIAKPRRPDRRVRRTRGRLGDAIVGLMHEKPFDSITVQEVLDRASVGRSTFYAHYRDKNDLFLSDADEFFEAMTSRLARTGERSDRVAPVAEFFAHAADAGPFRAALAASGRMADVMELGRRHFARAIEKRLGPSPRGRGRARAALAHALAGAVISLLGWWLEERMPFSAEEMDALFHGLVRGGARG